MELPIAPESPIERAVQSRQLAANFRWDRGHLVAHPQVQGESGTQTDVVLNVAAENGGAKAERNKGSAGNRSKKSQRIVGQKSTVAWICQRTENDFASGRRIERIR